MTEAHGVGSSILPRPIKMYLIFKNPAILVILIYLPQLILMFFSKHFSNNFNNTISNSKKDFFLEVFTGIVLGGILIYAYFSEISGNLILGFLVYFIGLILTYVGYFQFLFSKKKLVKNGIYSISRNPTYLFTTLSLIGICALINSLILTLIVIVHFILTHQVILKEEKYLEKKFGNDYLEYKKRVRRY